jgi:hypothetical protein
LKLIEAVAALDRHAVAGEPQGPLPLEVEAPLAQLTDHASLVGGFQESWPQPPVHRDRRRDDLICDVITIHSTFLGVLGVLGGRMWFEMMRTPMNGRTWLDESGAWGAGMLGLRRNPGR